MGFMMLLVIGVVVIIILRIAHIPKTKSTVSYLLAMLNSPSIQAHLPLFCTAQMLHKHWPLFQTDSCDDQISGFSMHVKVGSLSPDGANSVSVSMTPSAGGPLHYFDCFVQASPPPPPPPPTSGRRLMLGFPPNIDLAQPHYTF